MNPLTVVVTGLLTVAIVTVVVSPKSPSGELVNVSFNAISTMWGYANGKKQ